MKKNFILLIFLLVLGCINKTFAQQNKLKVRIAKIEVDSSSLDAYKAALAEHAKTAVSAEPGVLALNAVYDKDHPTHVTVFEIYASDSAYQVHIKTPHFLKYKSTTKAMVKSLELIDVTPIELAINPDISTYLKNK